MVKYTLKKKNQTKTKKYAKRKVYKPRNLKTVKYSPGIGTGISDSVFMKLSYTGDLVHVSSSNSFLGYHVWRLNSVYDPDKTGLGGQPKYHDQMSILYQNYIVYGCKVDMKAAVNSNAASSPNVGNANVMMWTSRVNEGSISQRDVRDNNAASMIINNEKPVGNLSRYYNISRGLGISKSQYASDNQYWCAVNTYPNIELFLNTGVSSFNGSEHCNVTLSCNFTFYVKYFSRKDVRDA